MVRAPEPVPEEGGELPARVRGRVDGVASERRREDGQLPFVRRKMDGPLPLDEEQVAVEVRIGPMDEGAAPEGRPDRLARVRGQKRPGFSAGDVDLEDVEVPGVPGVGRVPGTWRPSGLHAPGRWIVARERVTDCGPGAGRSRSRRASCQCSSPPASTATIAWGATGDAWIRPTRSAEAYRRRAVPPEVGSENTSGSPWAVPRKRTDSPSQVTEGLSAFGRSSQAFSRCEGGVAGAGSAGVTKEPTRGAP